MIEEQELDNRQKTKTIRPRWVWFFVVLLMTLILVVLIGYTITTPPGRQADSTTLLVEQGMSVRDIAREAKRINLVRSELLLYTILTVFNDPTNVHAGRYIFSEPMNTFAVGQKIASSDVDELLITLTIPEGVTIKRVAQLATEVLTEFETDEYIKLAKGHEGFLFPDTYYVSETFTAEDLFRLQSQTFVERVKPLEDRVVSSTVAKARESIILASIIEREANDEESMKMVAGILKNRLEIGMPLQADATIEYVLDTPLNELRPGELAQILKENRSPYNTYLTAGLPPTPIGNPGLMAIEAALFPTESDYLFYITGKDGEFYYAETLTQHNQNVANYLR